MSDRQSIVIDVRDSTDGQFPGRGQLPPREPVPQMLSDHPVRHHTDGKARPVALADTRKPSSRRRSLRAAMIAFPLALTAIALVVGHNHASPVRQPTDPSAVSFAVHHPVTIRAKTVGMPLTVGDAPVKPIRIVLDLTRRRTVPSAERVPLGEWISHTQNASTRLRIEVGRELSQPLSGRVWARSGHGTMTLAPHAAIQWLKAGARSRTPGALIRLGATARPRVLGARLRESWVHVSPQILRVHHALAAAIARQIMITSHQR